MPRRPAECRQLAQQAIASAELAQDEHLRSLLARIAAQWNRLADHVEACERFTQHAGSVR